MNIRLLIVVGMLGAGGTAHGAEVVNAEVALVEERYRVEFTVMLDGDLQRAWEIITDYARLAEVSPSVESSRLISGHAGEDARIEVVLRPCVLMIFCKTMTKISDIRVFPDHMRLQYTSVAGADDFREARETVELRAEPSEGGPRVRFTYFAVLRPKFFVPRFIGPWLIKRAIAGELEASIRRVERMLAGGAPGG